jgi:hypothetical protein
MQRPIGGKDGAHVPPDRDLDWISSSSVVSSFKLREPSIVADFGGIFVLTGRSLAFTIYPSTPYDRQ